MSKVLLLLSLSLLIVLLTPNNYTTVVFVTELIVT